jgi:hypothetical protein
LNAFTGDIISETLSNTPHSLEITAKPPGKAKAYLIHFYHNMKEGFETLPKQYHLKTVSKKKQSLALGS